MRVVLDTNAVLVSVSERSPFHWIMLLLENGKFTICVTTDILDEYAEVIEEHMDSITADIAVSTILQLPNHIKVEKYFFWQLVEKDPDDNKFVDCAIACNADYIVSEDRHLRALKPNEFYKTKTVTVAEFKELFNI
ncbi:MAG: putative toxin-antitoxin system toxin component, PIN family [Lewinellaceae bacterium]|nr:putative toxin-antitoxin system toxin component, PIN family [Saprospiraceae bacterium]MCB9337544.1 putative toxin-antitoxin system toxin component, PIN family [Lewinellaceae bacterium]